MPTARPFTALLVVLAGVTPVLAQYPLPPDHWVARPQDWFSKGPTLLPPDRNTPTYISDPTPPRPVPPPTPNYSQFRQYNAQGQAVFANPTTHQTRLVDPNAPSPLGFR